MFAQMKLTAIYYSGMRLALNMTMASSKICCSHIKSELIHITVVNRQYLTEGQNTSKIAAASIPVLIHDPSCRN